MENSPCIDECGLDDQGFCVGCGRTASEITSWRSMTDEEKQEVIERLTEEEEE